MKAALALVALNAVLCAAAPQYRYYSVAKWYFSNYLWPLPPALVQANENPAGTVSAPIGRSLPYTLRVNVTELAVENATDADEKKIDNAHIVATTFDLTYTGSHILNGTEASIEGNSSVAAKLWVVAYDYDFPQSVLDNYDPSSTGDCTKPLGAACVRALEQRGLSEYSFSGLHVSAPECADTLGSLRDAVDKDLGIVSIANSVAANATDSPVLWLASGAFSGRDQHSLDYELSKLQLVGVTVEEEDTDSGETSQVTSVVCFRLSEKTVKGVGMRIGLDWSLMVGIAVAAIINVG